MFLFQEPVNLVNEGEQLRNVLFFGRQFREFRQRFTFFLQISLISLYRQSLPQQVIRGDEGRVLSCLVRDLLLHQTQHTAVVAEGQWAPTEKDPADLLPFLVLPCLHVIDCDFQLGLGLNCTTRVSGKGSQPKGTSPSQRRALFCLSL